jgi:glutamate synthase domain-containing protein 3
MTANAMNMHFKELNEKLRTGDVTQVDNCCGQRFICSGMSGKNITINGTPGNALATYLNGSEITVNGNVQDAVGDTMNCGKVVVHGNAGDALGYAMRGGEIYVKGNAGYRAGIHMKEYSDKKPVLVIGGKVGSFLGEYLAGGIIIVLGLGHETSDVVGDFTGTGMHGGKIFIRTDKELKSLPAQVQTEIATSEDLGEVRSYIDEYCRHFDKNAGDILSSKFYVLKPNAKNPYKQLYTVN